MAGKEVSLKMIAKEAGASISTVSGILNGNASFSEERRKQIWEIATKLNYKPNKEARILRQGNGEFGTGRAKTGIVMHLSHSPDKEAFSISRSFESYRSLLLSAEAQRKNLNLFHYWYDNVAFSCQPLINGLVDGAIVGTPHLELIETLRRYRIQIVLLDVPFSVDTAAEAMVNFDMRLGMSLLLQRLKELGHRRIATLRIVHEASTNDYLGSRWFKIMEANASIGLDIDAGLSAMRIVPPYKHAPAIQDFVREALPRIRSGEVTAVLCLSDYYASELIEALSKAGLSVPGDVSVTGFSHNETFESSVTSVSNSWADAVNVSVELLKDKIESPETPNREILIRPMLFEGDSVAAPSSLALSCRKTGG